MMATNNYVRVQRGLTDLGTYFFDDRDFCDRDAAIKMANLTASAYGDGCCVVIWKPVPGCSEHPVWVVTGSLPVGGAQ